MAVDRTSAPLNHLPVGIWKNYSIPPGLTEHPDVFLVPVSPPERQVADYVAAFTSAH